MAAGPVVLKFGGELLEDAARLATVVAAVRTIVAAGTEGASASGAGVGPRAVVIVHGGGKEIDAALKVAGIEKRQVDGLRITDARTLDVVVSVLAGAVNTRFVAALNAAGVPAVGLTGADARLGLSAAAPPHRAVDGRLVDLDRVGVPVAESDTRLLQTLVAAGFVPVVACIGAGPDGQLFNVNADTLAGHLAARVGAARLVIAGTTPGVMDGAGETLPLLESSDLLRLVSDGTATAGMVAKLRACEQALGHGVEEVVIVDGRHAEALVAAATDARLKPCATTLVPSRNVAV